MEKRLKETGKQEQFYSIALLDILGFSNYVTTHGNQTILELYNKLLDIVYTPDISKAVPIRMSDDWKEGQYIANANGHVNVCHFLSRTSNTRYIMITLFRFGISSKPMTLNQNLLARWFWIGQGIGESHQILKTFHLQTALKK